MAEGKKSFTAYCDWKETFDSLPDEKAGQLIKHLFSYVNDENPETDDILIKAVFAQMKATLKRDLKKWESKREQNRENARKRWNKNNATASERIIKNANNAVSVSVRDRVSVSEIIDKSITKESFIKIWNKVRTEILKKPSYLNRISFEEEKLLKSITEETLTNALKGFFKQTVFPNGQNYTTNTKHFLNHFNVYLQAYHDKNANIYGKKE